MVARRIVMMTLTKLGGSLALAAGISAVGCNVAAISCHHGAPAETADRDADAAAAAWRAKHEADYRRDWVTIAGLHALKPGVNTAGSDATNDIVLPPPAPPTIGRFVLSDAGVRFEPATQGTVLLSNAKVKGAPIDIRLVVHRSGEHRGIRVRDPNGPLARGFAGFTWFPIDSAYRVAGTLIRDAQPQKLEVVNTYGDVDRYETEGVVEFTLQGRTLRLRPFTTRPKRFYFVFRDASSGQETYKTARFLYADLRDDGTTVLDFNQAYNPPCAFNPYTTCPIPLRENRLPVKILAGERAYAGPEPALIAPPK
jgi:uncharacterized protein (DUF1684 family)